MKHYNMYRIQIYSYKFFCTLSIHLVRFYILVHFNLLFKKHVYKKNERKLVEKKWKVWHGICTTFLYTFPVSLQPTSRFIVDVDEKRGKKGEEEDSVLSSLPVKQSKQQKTPKADQIVISSHKSHCECM